MRDAAHRPRWEPETELLDRPLPFAETDRALADLTRVNHLLLGSLPVARTLAPRIAAAPGPQRLLDLGTGAGDVPERLLQEAARRGTRLTVIGLDRKLSHLVIGRLRGTRQLRVVGDALALPFRDGAVHWTLSNLLFHHFSPGNNRRVLAEMRRVALRAAAVVDLRRGRLTSWLARVLLPLAGLGRVARYDGRLSADRSSSLAEVRRLVADLPVLELRPRFPRRFSLVLAAGGAPAPDEEADSGVADLPTPASTRTIFSESVTEERSP